jgi:5'-nucleotidase
MVRRTAVLAGVLLIAEERAGEAPVLLFDAGDTWQDFRRPLPAVWGADRMVEWMNRVGYDAMALGNHDMYWGAERLDGLARKANFPILCANLRPVRHGSVPFASSARLEADEVSVLAIGLITEELLPYSAYPALHVVPAATAVRDEIDRAANDAELIVVVAHRRCDPRSGAGPQDRRVRHRTLTRGDNSPDPRRGDADRPVGGVRRTHRPARDRRRSGDGRASAD